MHDVQIAHVGAREGIVVAPGPLPRGGRLLLDQSAQTSRIAAEVRRLQRAQREPMMGALIRRVPVRVVEASIGGCVMECPSIVVEGTIGFVQIRTKTQGHSEAVRINRTARTTNRTWRV